jgi:hypothetical protein
MDKRENISPIHDLIGKFFCSSWSSERETVVFLLGSFTMVGSQIRDGN